MGLLVLLGTVLGIAVLAGRKGPAHATGALQPGPILLPNAFAKITNDEGTTSPDRGDLIGAWEFTADGIARSKLLRYRVTSRSGPRTLPGGGGLFEVIRAQLTFHDPLAAKTLPLWIRETALGAVLHPTFSNEGRADALAASRALASVPDGTVEATIEALSFTQIMDNLRLFPATITLVVGDPQVLRTLATGARTATTDALGIGPDLAILATDLSRWKDTISTQAYVDAMIEKTAPE